ncbi:MAG: hypothetical protein IJE06_04340 [Alistipes sp.]|nr:hypothetical protein [Alistipes sp.]
MKKFFSLMMIAAAFAFVACGDPIDDETVGGGKLATPQLSETHTETSITVSWGAVENAEAYIVNLAGKTYNTEACEYTFENLNAGKYTIRVGATAAGYEDSDLAKIEVTLTGATEVDWFTQTVSLPDVDETVDYGNGQVVVYQPYNGVKVLWKGTGVDDIKFGLFETESIADATDAQIKNNLKTFDEINGALELINSADGLEVIYGDCTGSTTYTACVWVKNEAGIEFFTKEEITTDPAVVSEATKAWLGTWNAYTEKVVDLTLETNPVKDQRTDFTFTVSVVPGTADQVTIDGISVMGTGTPAFGQVVEKEGVNYLAIISQTAIADIGEGYYATWLPYCELGSGEFTFVTGEFAAIYLAMGADGSVTYQPAGGDLQNGETFSVQAFDVLAYDFNGRLGILSDQSGNEFNVWKFGDWKGISKAQGAAARVTNNSARKLSVSSVLNKSLVAY